MSSKIYDNHTLHLTTGSATQAQVEGIFSEVANNLGLDGTWTINIIVGRNGCQFGIGYAFVDNPELYFSLLGKELNGENRYEVVDDPKWSPPEQPLHEALAEHNNREVDISSTKASWADMDDGDQLIRNRYNCPQIRVPSPSLVNKELLNYVNEETDEIEYIAVNPAFIMRNDDVYHNLLVAKRIPEWVTASMLKPKIMLYVTSKRKIYKGKYANNHYPIIEIQEPRNGCPRDTRNIYIRYDPKTTDGEFSLHMIRRLFLKSPDGENIVIIFDNQRRKSNSRCSSPLLTSSGDIDQN